MDKTFWLVERGEPEGLARTYWWAGGDTWVTDVNDVPPEFRFESKVHIQVAIAEKHDYEGGWSRCKCRFTEHMFVCEHGVIEGEPRFAY